jgi:hypothetical protein
MKKKKLGEVLRERERISASLLAQVIAEQQGKIILLGELLLERQLVEKTQLVSALEEVTNMPYVDCRAVTPDPDALRKIAQNLARKCLALPIAQQGSKLVVVMAEPQNLALLNELKSTASVQVSPRFGFRDEILQAIDKYYGGSGAVTVTFPAPEMDQGKGDRAEPEFLTGAAAQIARGPGSAAPHLLIRPELILEVLVACLITWGIAWLWLLPQRLWPK